MCTPQGSLQNRRSICLIRGKQRLKRGELEARVAREGKSAPSLAFASVQLETRKKLRLFCGLSYKPGGFPLVSSPYNQGLSNGQNYGQRRIYKLTLADAKPSDRRPLP